MELALKYGELISLRQSALSMHQAVFPHSFVLWSIIVFKSAFPVHRPLILEWIAYKII